MTGLPNRINAGQAGQQLGLIGPNSVIQLREALITDVGAQAAEHLFELAGHQSLFHNLPDTMIDEAIPQALFATLFAHLPLAQARRIAEEAGKLTANYIIANRIPKLVVKAFRLLPPRFAGRFLMKAIEKNAWTFVGSGHCGLEFDKPPTIWIENNPLVMPDGCWHRAVFLQLFQRIVCPKTEVECQCASNVTPKAPAPPKMRFPVEFGTALPRTVCPQPSGRPFSCMLCRYNDIADMPSSA